MFLQGFIFGSTVRSIGVPPDLNLYTLDSGECSMSIYVGNLSYEVTQEHLSQTFGEYGTVKRIQLPADRETGRMRGFAFVEMSTEAEETAAIEALDGAEWMGSRPQSQQSKTP